MARPAPARSRFGSASVDSGDELRETAYGILQRSYRRAEERRKGSGIRVYLASARSIAVLCGERWVRSTVVPEEYLLTRRFLDSTGLAAGDVDAVISRSLMGNMWSRIWTEILLALEPGDFERVVKSSGEARLDELAKSGRGAVCVHTHSIFAQFFWRWLEHRGMDEGVTLRQWTWGRQGGDVQDRKTAALEGAKELHAAMSALRKGRIVHVLADGHQGGEHEVMDFFNRRRPFRKTFAELAVANNAPVIPVDVRLRPEARILVEVGSPLPDDPGADRGERARRLVRGYVDHLSRQWRRHPADIPWSQMKLHLRYPPAGQADPEDQGED